MNLDNLQCGTFPDNDPLLDEIEELSGAQPDRTDAELNAEITAEINANFPKKTSFYNAPITDAELAADDEMVSIRLKRFKRMRQRNNEDRETINTLTVRSEIAEDAVKRQCVRNAQLNVDYGLSQRDLATCQEKLEESETTRENLCFRLASYVETIEKLTSELSTERLQTRRNIRALNRENARLRSGGPVLRNRPAGILVPDSDEEESDHEGELDGDPSDSDAEFVRRLDESDSEFVPSSPLI